MATGAAVFSPVCAFRANFYCAAIATLCAARGTTGKGRTGHLGIRPQENLFLPITRNPMLRAAAEIYRGVSFANNKTLYSMRFLADSVNNHMLPHPLT